MQKKKAMSSAGRTIILTTKDIFINNLTDASQMLWVPKISDVFHISIETMDTVSFTL